MPICPDYIRYNELLVPIAITEIIKNDSHFIDLFTNTDFTNFKIYPFSLLDENITFIKKKLILDNTTDCKRALAIYFDNEVKYKDFTTARRESELKIYIEIAIQVDSKNLEEKAKQEAHLISKDIEHTLFNENRSLKRVITNPFTNITELFNVGKVKVINNEWLLKGAINNKNFTFIHLIELEICTNI